MLCSLLEKLLQEAPV